MHALVDVNRQEVRSADRVWPFELDCRDDIVSIALDNEVFRLRPLSWRAKRNLARYAGLGEAFVTRHFIRACLVDDAALPTDQAAYDALWVLARWINAPVDNGTGLPLDPSLLTSVALEVARDSGVPLVELDEQNADAVEQLWLDHRHGAPRGESEIGPARRAEPRRTLSRQPSVLPDPGDMDRIVIVPDPPAVDGRSFSPLDPAMISPTLGKPAMSSPAVGEPATSSPTLAEPELTSPRAEITTADGAAFNGGVSDRGVRERVLTDLGRQPARFRVSMPPIQVANRPAPPESDGWEPAAAPGRTLLPAADQSIPRIATLPALMSDRAAPAPHLLPTQSAAHLFATQSAAHLFATQLTDVRAMPPSVVTGGQEALETAEVEDLFDLWVERLEHAAEQLGIDLEA